MQLAVEVSADFNKNEKDNQMMRNRLYIFTVITGWLLGSLLPAMADEEASKPFDEYKVKAVFLYNFTKFVKWPGEFSLTQTHNANVCVFGENPFNGRLDILEKTSSPELIFHIKRNVSEGEIGNCQILFISKSEANSVSALLSGTRDRPVLTVSDIDGFARDGGIIEMKNNENNIGKKSIKLIINLGAAKDKKLDIDAQLLAIAAEVIK